MSKLTVAKVKALKAPGFYADGGTLFLRVAPGGSKQWMQRLTVNGRRHDLGLGGYPLVSLAEAREAAFENRKLARTGGDPLREKRKANMPTFREAAHKTMASRRATWKSDKTAAKWKRGMDNYACPVIGDIPVDRIEQADVLKVLVPVWTAKAETARVLRQSIRTVFAWAMANQFVEHNPAGDGIDAALPRMPKVKRHHRALPYRDVAAALDTVKASTSSEAVKLAFEFLVLTAARSGEVREARWSEIDRQAREWRIPASRMKAGHEHRVPLSEAALNVLGRAEGLQDRSGLIFPSPARQGRPMSDMTLTKLLRDNGLADRATVHGFRSCFRDWCADTGKPRELAEAALAHVVGGVEGAYFRSDLMTRRRALMSGWADYLNSNEAEVIKLHG